MMTNLELEYHWDGEEKVDAFDDSAKSLFLGVTRIYNLFRGKNLRVNAIVTLEDPVHSVTSIMWDGISGSFKVNVDGSGWINLSDASADRPWLMIPLASNAEKLFEEAVRVKVEMASEMADASIFGWLEELK
tara:strand:- start:10416 stop:10811 length:396 start_codon:yes stop_codon:yes gene_type:complete